MKNLKKIMAMAFAVTMISSLAAGCVNTNANPGNSANTSKADSAAAGEKVTLEFWHIQTTDPVKTVIADSMKRFEADNTNYTVNVTPVANDAYKQKLAVAMASGQTPDIYIHWTGGPMVEYINSGYTADLTEYMNADNYKDMYLDAAIEQVTYKDKIYAVPLENVSVAGVFYNTELFNKYNLTEPKTIADLEKICDTFVSNGIAPFSLANATKWTGSMYYMYFATRFGGIDPFKDAAAGTGTFESEPFKYAGQKVQEWVDKKYFNEGFNGLDEDSGQSKQLFYTEAAAMQLMGSWVPSAYKADSEEFYKKVGFFPFPSLDTSDAPQDVVVGTIGDNFCSISPKCPDVAGAFKAITYLLDDKAIEERTAAGKIVPIKGFKSDDPLLQDVISCVESASSVQLWYDQYLPPEVAEIHKSTSQEIFGKTMTPEEADKQLQAAMDAYLKKAK